MTENRKSLLMIIFATVLAVSALVYGFSAIPNPTQQREYKLDHKRVSDLGEIQFSLDEYYRTSKRLPDSLQLLINSYYSSKALTKNDPQTNTPYEYKVLSPTSYQLCATFITDTKTEKYSYDEENYNYSNFRDKFTHPKGRYCFDLHTPVDDQYSPQQYSPGVTIYPVGPISPTTTPFPSIKK